MNTDLAAVAAVIATVSALVTLLVGVEQLTSASRLRREATFWREGQQAETGEYEKAVMQSLRRTAIARIISLRMIPARLLLLPINLTVLPLAYIFALAYWTPGHSTSFERVDWSGAVFALVIQTLVTGVGIHLIATVFAKRRRLVRTHLDGIMEGLPNLTAASPYEPRIPLTKTQQVSLSALALGLGFTAFSIGMVIHVFRTDDPLPFAVAWLTSFLGAVVLVAAGYPGYKALSRYERFSSHLGPDIRTAELLDHTAAQPKA
ncbi:hypothetical protein [Arthrobacter sp. H16F315]|uniref:hypothetical protein n=1 Tax=Arthrobacter sp. H16F315 TaxID=2955314 RepID=UPI002097EE15|nr:hypothetical protein [Arthrobacter sp. H16F315]MDD1477933.1 hypothetical protein [Arthrobacter sp. H16F315]